MQHQLIENKVVDTSAMRKTLKDSRKYRTRYRVTPIVKNCEKEKYY